MVEFQAELASLPVGNLKLNFDGYFLSNPGWMGMVDSYNTGEII